MDLGLAGKRALVLASSRGLGLGIATALVAEGAHVVITGRNAERLATAAETLSAGGSGRADSVASDFAADGAVDRVGTTAADRDVIVAERDVHGHHQTPESGSREEAGAA